MNGVNMKDWKWSRKVTTCDSVILRLYNTKTNYTELKSCTRDTVNTTSESTGTDGKGFKEDVKKKITVLMAYFIWNEHQYVVTSRLHKSIVKCFVVSGQSISEKLGHRSKYVR